MQSQDETMLRSSDILSYVKPILVFWNGTSALWSGLDRDRPLAGEIHKVTDYLLLTADLSIVESLKACKNNNTRFVTLYD